MTLEETIGAVVAAMLVLLKAVHYYRARASGHTRWESLRPWPLQREPERWERLNERVERLERACQRRENVGREREREPDTLRPPSRKPMLSAAVSVVREPDGTQLILPLGSIGLAAGDQHTFRYLVPHRATLLNVVLSRGRLIRVLAGPHDVVWLPTPEGQFTHALEETHVDRGSVVAVTVEGTPE